MIYYNYLCFLTLVKKEVFRFLKVGIQTVIGPAISSLLFLAVFSLALGRSVNSINGIDPHKPSVNYGKKKYGLQIDFAFGEKLPYPKIYVLGYHSLIPIDL
mgnify:CR=1 FL=1